MRSVAVAAVVVACGGCVLDIDADFTACDDGSLDCVGAEGEGEEGEEGEGEGEVDPCAVIDVVTVGDVEVDDEDEDLVERIEGNVIVDAPDELNFPNLCEITGDLIVDGSQRVEIIRFPRLRSVGGKVRVVNTADVEEVDLPALQTVGGDVIFGDMFVGNDLECPDDPNFDDCILFAGNPSMTEVHLPALESVGGTFRIVANAALLTIDAAHPFSVGSDLLVSTNSLLADLTLGVTTAKRLVSIDDNVKLRRVQLPNLTQVTARVPLADDEIFNFTGYGLATNGSLYIWTSSFDGIGPDGDFQEIENFDAPVLATLEGALIISDVVVTELALPALTSVRSIYLTTNFGSARAGHADQGVTTFAAPLLVTPADNTAGFTGVGPRFFRSSADGFGFTNCLEGTTLCLEANARLTSIVLGETLSLAGGLTIEGNSRVVDICSLGDLVDVGADVAVLRNDALPTFSFLSSLRTIGGSLDLTDNDSAPDCEASLINAAVTGQTSFDGDGNRAGADCSGGLPVCTDTLP